MLKLVEPGNGNPTCESCRFWARDGSGAVGECRRFPPHVAWVDAGPDDRGWSSAFPLTRSDAWCGDHGWQVR